MFEANSQYKRKITLRTIKGSLRIFEMRTLPEIQVFSGISDLKGFFNPYPFMNLNIKVHDASVDTEALKNLAS